MTTRKIQLAAHRPGPEADGWRVGGGSFVGRPFLVAGTAGSE